MNKTIESCNFVYSLLQPPAIYVYGCLFIIGGIVAAVGNIVALVILWQPQMRSKSNKMLTSLVVSDALVGYVLFPFTAYQMFEITSLKNCTYETIRIYLSISLIGTSAINVALIAYDRYILMTKVTQYNKHVTNKKMNALIVVAWVFPAACVSLDYVSLYLYIATLCMIIFGPLIALTVFYCLITKAIRRKEDEIISNSKKRNHSIQQTQDCAAPKEQQRSRHRVTKLARQVTLLIVCYVLCLFPSAIALIVNMTYIVTDVNTPLSVQIFFLISLLAASSNSWVNPIIYAAKYPEFRRCLRKQFGWNKESSYRIETNLTENAVSVI